LTVSGSHYEVGRAIGKTFSSRIQGFFDNSSDFNQWMLPFAQTEKGKQIIENYTVFNQMLYPQYFEELQGMADGSGLPYSNFVLSVMGDEILALAGDEMTTETLAPTRVDHCTDLHLRDPSSGAFILAHNEDGDNITKPYAYVVVATFLFPNGSAELTMTSYYYPGNIAGEAFGWNNHGSISNSLVFSENAIFPLEVATGPVLINMVLSRALYDCSELDCLINTIAAHPRSYGFSLNVGFLAPPHDIYNFEIAAGSFNVYKVATNYSHVNEIKHLPFVAQWPDPSSAHRQRRIWSLPPISSLQDMTHLLGDSSDPDYPIYRDSAPPDSDTTLATVFFDLAAASATVFAQNPALASSTPVLVAQLGASS